MKKHTQPWTGNSYLVSVSDGAPEVTTLNVDYEGFQTGDAIDSVSVQGSSLDVRAKVEQDGTGNAAHFVNNKFVDSDTACPRDYYLKSRGSKASPAILQDGDIINCRVVGAYDGSEYRIASLIRTVVNDLSPALGNISADLIFFISTGKTFEEVLKLDKDKKASFSGDVDVTGKVTVSEGFVHAVNRETLSGNQTLTATSEEYQFLDANGTDRDVTAEATPATGRRYVVKNIGSANILKFKNNAGTQIGNNIAIGISATFLYDGTEWQVV